MTIEHHHFGGDHTEKKLRCLREYLSAYTTALKQQGFATLYIDAFAGTGSRAETRAALPILGQHDAETITTEGSAAIALATKPEFHHIALIEQDPDKVAGLKAMLERFPGARAHIRQGDANLIVRRICEKTQWRGRGTVGRGVRGVIFLDPYGMEVEWATVEAIADTKALDCWYFVPLSGLYRNAPHDPLNLDDHKIRALNRVLGTDEWRSAWYNTPPTHQTMMPGLFDEAERRVADVDAIEAYVKTRLKTVFKGAVLDPLRIYNKTGAPLASLFFAISNDSPQAVKVATKIAGHILKAGISSHVR